MHALRIVIDTNVVVAALRSSRGASHALLQLVGSGRFEINVSVPLVLEYEAVTKRLLTALYSESDIDTVLDYLCAVAHRREVFHLWRPFLRDANDDMVLELAVTAGCDCIVTYNVTDFAGIEQFGLRAVTPRQFLQEIGEIT